MYAIKDMSSDGIVSLSYPDNFPDYEKDFFFIFFKNECNDIVTFNIPHMAVTSKLPELHKNIQTICISEEHAIFAVLCGLNLIQKNDNNIIVSIKKDYLF